MAPSDSNLSPRPGLQMGLVVVAFLTLVAGVYLIGQDVRAVIALVIGATAVVVLLVLYSALLRWTRRRRGRPLERAIVGNSAAMPQNVSEPARLAALDDLRKKFEAGLTKFRAAGKDLYSLPWYAIVGEPGSGKTEAIRRCNVGFPPGLQDCAQGAGGTINMNWWFTNHAVLIDTAGRMVFDDRAPARGSEWNEFLTLLARARPNCPINGLLLVLPADSLITDTADRIEQKAGNIAKQLDQIQRTLGVRFPVFVIVSKCDLINGFREFFEDLTDPQLQHQMFGWSNPEPRDEPFRPELLDQHLLAIRGRLLRRRQQLLADPVHTSNTQGRRIEQVDALYTLPDAFVRIGPRLRRYLEMIFMPGEWSAQPLFLRGIYFTSSVRDGSAIDAELAQAVKLPIEALNADSRSWERERAYFLRDLFINKVFREKGLVTRATDTRGLQRQRKLLLAAAAGVALSWLIYCSWSGARSLNGSIGVHTRIWTAIDANWKDHRDDWSIVRPAGGGAWRYNGGQAIDIAGAHTTLGQFFAQITSQTDKPIVVPWVFRVQQVLRGGLSERRQRACREMLEASVFAPAVEAAREKLRNLPSEAWSHAAGDALGELLRLETAQAGLFSPATSTADSGSAPVRLDLLLQFVLSEEDYRRYKTEDREAIVEAADRIYGSWDGAGRKKTDPLAGSAGAGTEAARSAIDSGVRAAERYYLARLQGHTQRLADLKLVVAASGRMDRAEEPVVRSLTEADIAHATPQSLIRQAPEWIVQLHEIEAARQMLEEALARLERDGRIEKPLLDLYESEIQHDATAAAEIHEALAALIPKASSGEASPELAPMIRHLQATRQALREAAERFPLASAAALTTGLRKELAHADKVYLAPVRGFDGLEHRGYLVLGTLYDRARMQLIALSSTGDRSGNQPGVESEQADATLSELLRQLETIGSSTSGQQVHDVVAIVKSLAGQVAKQRKEHRAK